MSLISTFMGGGTLKEWVSGTTYALNDIRICTTTRQPYIRIVAGAGATVPSSDATNWRPFGATPIKSIQRGILAMTQYSATATITSVVTAKTELRICGVDAGYNQVGPNISLTNSTTITSQATTGYSYSNISWELTEYY